MAASPKSPPCHLLVIVIIIFIAAAAANMCDAKKNVTGFSSRLIHRDHPKSPLYNPKLTKWERVEESVRRSLPRMNSLATAIRRRNTPNDMLSNMTLNGGEYFMEYTIGGPGVKTLGLIDTGSEFTWLHCKPCLSEPKQCGDPSSLFDPSRSITYIVQDCSESCSDVSPMFSCNKSDNTCKYVVEYGDGTISRGTVAMEGIAFFDNEMGQVVFRITIGCGYEDVYTTALRPQGLVGLSKGKLSLANQIELRSFSHCFDEATDVSSSTGLHNVMRFGTNSILDGGKTPMLEGKFMENFYFLHLEGISVGDTRVKLPEGYTFNISDSGTKGFVIDSGTTFTYLEEQSYDAVVNEMTSAIKDSLPACAAAIEGTLKPCYCPVTMQDLEGVAPDLTYHFGGGLDVTLGKSSTWVHLGHGKICLALFSSGKNELSVFGNYNQRNLNVAYDLTRKEMHFQPMKNCSSTYA